MFEGLKKRKIKYSLKISKRARQMRLEIRNNGSVNVVVPQGINYGLVDRFIAEKSKWIIDKLDYFKSISEKETLFRQGFGRARYLQYKEKARILAENRISHYNKLYNFKISRIAIKNTKSRWGSCSKKRNLNFNYKIALLSQELAFSIL